MPVQLHLHPGWAQAGRQLDLDERVTAGDEVSPVRDHVDPQIIRANLPRQSNPAAAERRHQQAHDGDGKRSEPIDRAPDSQLPHNPPS